MDWNSQVYDAKHDFVAEYGKGLLEYVPRNAQQTILDLGCGTGTLTIRLADLCSRVVGIDCSQSMIDTAKRHFDTLEFFVCDALALPFEHEFNLVFSNAVFHWISDHDTLLKNIRKALKPQGLLVCEFGAKGNIATIEHAFSSVSHEMGYDYAPKFNFPTAEAFGTLLKKNAFTVDTIYEYDRPTLLKDNKQGLENWIKQFFASEFMQMPDTVQEKLLREVEERTSGTLWNGTSWVADYRRLRAVAHL